MSRPCPLAGCGATLGDDVEICRGDARRLQLALTDVPELLDELDTSLARIGSTWTEPGGIHGRATGGCKPGCDHSPDNPSCVAETSLDVNLAASEAAAQLRIVLHGWARVWDEETPIRASPPDVSRGGEIADRTLAQFRLARRARDFALGTAARQARLLAHEALAGRPWAPDIAREILDAVAKARRAIDRPPDVTLAGTCTCGAAVYATAGDLRARCRACGVARDPQELYDAMLEARGHLHTAPAAVIARMLTDVTTGKPLVTAAQIRGWKHRGAIEAAEVNAAGQPCYSLADVAKLAREGAPEAERIEA